MKIALPPLVLIAVLASACATAPTPKPPPPERIPATGGEVAAAPEPVPDPVPAEPPSPAGPTALERGRESRRLAAEAAARGDGTAAQLHLADAAMALDGALAATPDDRASRHERALVHRDAYEFDEATALLRGLMEERDDDPETLYDLAYCTAYGGDFEGGRDLFLRARERLGPQGRVLVNLAICEDKLGRTKDALATLADLHAAEVAAGRSRGADGRRALEKTWEFTVQRGDYDGGRAALTALADAHPGEPSPPYMLGNLLMFRREHAAAAEAFLRAATAGDGLPAAWPRRAAALLAAGDVKGAEVAVREALTRAPGDASTGASLLEIARALLRGRSPAAARGLLADGAALFAADPAESERVAGEAALAEGNLEAARDAFALAAENSPFDSAAPARLRRTRLALTRAGLGSDRVLVETVEGTPDAPAPPSTPLLDFDSTQVFVRADSPGATGTARVVDGAMRLPPGPPEATPQLRLELFPDLDLTGAAELLVRVRTGGGPAGIRLAILDGYDEANPMAVRSRWPADGPAAEIGADTVVLAVPPGGLGNFEPRRPLAPFLRRVRTLMVRVEPVGGTPLPEVFIEDVRFVDGSTGAVLTLADFEGEPEEALVAYEGTSIPFQRTLFDGGQVAGFAPPGTTPVTPAILGDGFHPSMVGAGSGSMRLHHGEAGPAGPARCRVLLNPDRDVRHRSEIVFLARGATGGERLRVVMEDAHDVAAAAWLDPARTLRAVFPRSADGDGALTLAKEWHRYRIPLDAYPDLDFAALAAINFEFGEDVGNAAGTVIFLDDLGFE